MGSPIPTKNVEIDPLQQYDVRCHVWKPWPLPEGCQGEYLGIQGKTVFGQTIIDWLEAGNHCTFNVLVSPPLAGRCDALIDWTPWP